MRIFKAVILVTLACTLFVSPFAAYADEPVSETKVGDFLMLDESAGSADMSSPERSISLAASGPIAAVTGCPLGDGTYVSFTATIDQKGVYQTALKDISYWRKDALNDTGIKLHRNGSWYTIREYLSKMGISESEYLNPQWSNELEKVAIQRAAEIHLYYSHTCPNDGDASDYCSSVDAESLAAFSTFDWESTGLTSGADITTAISLWASEKTDYVNALNGKSHGETGHYLALIDPAFKYVGFAGCSLPKEYSVYWSSWAAEFSRSSSAGSGATGLTDRYSFETTLSDSQISDRCTSIWSGSDALTVGDSTMYALNFTYKTNRTNLSYGATGYETADLGVKGSWSSSNTKVATVNSNGKVTGVSKGTATITLNSNGKKYTKTVTVSNDKVMHRLYNPNSGEHFYTASAAERDNLVKVGWKSEGVGWYAPSSSKSPVYRLYSGTDHHYTTNVSEKNYLVKVGWKHEGIGWYSDDAQGVPLYRQFNPNVNPKAKYNNSGSHNYTTSKAENDSLVKVGWKAEGIGWYGVK